MSSANNLRTFEDLEAWKACRAVRVFVAKEVCPLLPPDERFLLRSQLIDAARSTTANIAEGWGRYHYLDNAKFCRIARGSLMEVLDHLITANDEGMITPECLEKGRELIGNAAPILNGYIRYLSAAAKTDRLKEDPIPYGKNRDRIDAEFFSDVDAAIFEAQEGVTPDK
ncbi:MAG: four helix bundle protein [Verrucomicrobiales bacterium]